MQTMEMVNPGQLNKQLGVMFSLSCMAKNWASEYLAVRQAAEGPHLVKANLPFLLALHSQQSDPEPQEGNWNTWLYHCQSPRA